MIIIRVPFRISLFGGGTDFPDFFNKYGGQVISFTIDKYCYVSFRNLPEFTEHNIKISYSKIEQCKEISEIEHPLIRTSLKFFKKEKIEIHYDADLPANSGLGSSSAFAVGLAHGLSIMNNKKTTKRSLANTAIDWERKILKENGGYQDQVASAYGDFNNIIFSKNDFQVKKMYFNNSFIDKLISRIVICYIPRKKLGINLSSSNTSEIKNIQYLHEISEITKIGIKKLISEDIDGVGEMIRKSWEIKKKFKNMTTEIINDLVSKGLKEGAIGAKLLGAGGGGFIMFFCSENGKENLVASLKPFCCIPINISRKGSEVLFQN
tara:strand:+ start:301 stop:1266 length:966 start_codon:yes stop_codon:yes gene_type:complete